MSVCRQIRASDKAGVTKFESSAPLYSNRKETRLLIERMGKPYGCSNHPKGAVDSTRNKKD